MGLPMIPRPMNPTRGFATLLPASALEESPGIGVAFSPPRASATPALLPVSHVGLRRARRLDPGRLEGLGLARLQRFYVHRAAEVSPNQIGEQSPSIRMLGEGFGRLIQIGQLFVTYLGCLFGEAAQDTLRFFFLDLVVARHLSFFDPQ